MVAGNPISTRLESGIGNCFPGLECDLRNLERRFFPGLEVNITDNRIDIVGVDTTAARAAVRTRHLTKRSAALLKRIDTGLRAGQVWRVDAMRGVFGPLGLKTAVVTALRPNATRPDSTPPDAWTALRLLPEGSKVTLTVRAARSHRPQLLSGRRARYLDDHGALAAAFLPGELTQSLCSPWTHDFRDCGCFYWASNHPDIAKPPLPKRDGGDPEWNAPVPWERADRALNKLPRKSTQLDSTNQEFDHYEINRRWQELNFVLGGRELVGPYVPETFTGKALASRAELITHLRYAAGVELAVVQEYLAAAFSFQDPAIVKPTLRKSVITSHAELMRIAVSEMHHIRVVNDVLRMLQGRHAFRPALQVARRLPGAQPGKTRPLEFHSADPEAINRFIEIEQPSVSVDGLYSRILATLNDSGTEPQQNAIRTVMAEGEDHYETFRFIKEWLHGHAPADYLRGADLQPPPKGDPAHAELQRQYRAVLEDLYRGYRRGFPEGAHDVNAARQVMIASTGMQDSIRKIAGKGFLISFDWITNDARFAPINSP